MKYITILLVLIFLALHVQAFADAQTCANPSLSHEDFHTNESESFTHLTDPETGELIIAMGSSGCMVFDKQRICAESFSQANFDAVRRYIDVYYKNTGNLNFTFYGEMLMALMERVTNEFQPLIQDYMDTFFEANVAQILDILRPENLTQAAKTAQTISFLFAYYDLLQTVLPFSHRLAKDPRIISAYTECLNRQYSSGIILAQPMATEEDPIAFIEHLRILEEGLQYLQAKQ